MGKWLLVLFTVVPLVEFYLLTWVGGLVGFWPTVGLVLITGMIGASLARREGARVLSQWQRDLAAGKVPADGVLGGLLVLVGGVLLVTPGVLTDLVGLALLLPPTRRALAAVIKARLEKAVANGTVQVSMGGLGGFPGGVGGGFPGGFGGGFPGGFSGGFPGGFGRADDDIIDVEGEDISDGNEPRLPDR